MFERHSVNKIGQKTTRQLLRENQTPTEAILWQSLRRKELGEKFVRQHGIENYIVDFCCRRKKLIIEIDGSIHNKSEAKENDDKRTEYLERLGYKIIRFKNQEVLDDTEQVLEKIKSSLK
jgi:very-short-patch-repair endonuclease